MRWLFLLLLLANVGYFGWQALRPAKVESVAAAPQGQGLELLTSLPEGSMPPLRVKKVEPAAKEPELQVESSDEPTPAAPPPPPPPQRRCLQLAGFDTPAESEALMKRMLNEGMQLEARGEEAVTTQNYWVLMPPYNNKHDAEAVIRQLKARKLRDLYRVRTGESKNAISLGVFSTKAAADRRYREVVNIGLKGKRPQIKVLELQAKRYWLRLSYPNETEIDWSKHREKDASWKGREWACEESR